MALSVDTLTAEFIKIIDETNANFVGWPTTVAQAITNWTNAYDVYAMAAQDAEGSIGDSLVLPNKIGFSSALTAVWKDIPPGPPGTEEATATSFVTAMTAYWTLAAFGVIKLYTGFSTEATSIATVFAPVNFYTDFVTLTKKQTTKERITDMAKLAEELAKIFHAATQTVTITITGMSTSTPPAPLVVSNLPIV